MDVLVSCFDVLLVNGTQSYVYPYLPAEVLGYSMRLRIQHSCPYPALVSLVALIISGGHISMPITTVYFE